MSMEKDFLSPTVVENGSKKASLSEALKSVPPVLEVGDPEHLAHRITGTTSVEALNTVLLELSSESEYLKFKRAQLDAISPGIDTSHICQRRAVILDKIASVIQTRDKTGAQIDLDHPVIRMTIEYFFQKLKEVLESESPDRPALVNGQQKDAILTELGRVGKDYYEVLSERMEESGLKASK